MWSLKHVLAFTVAITAYYIQRLVHDVSLNGKVRQSSNASVNGQTEEGQRFFQDVSPVKNKLATVELPSLCLTIG